MRPHYDEHSLAVIGTALLVLALMTPPASAQQSQNITLLAHQNLHSRYSGSWPYIHTDGREYVAVGTREGTSIVRLTDPANPVEVAFIPGPISGIREAGQYQTYLYVVGLSQNSPGIQVISMADPDNPAVVNTVLTTTSAENVTIDTARGYLYTTESFPTAGRPGLHIYSLADPTNPVRIGVYEGYQVHDFTVKGTRGYACDQVMNMVHILDMTNPATPVELAAFTSAIGTTHTAVPTADDRHLIVVDENFTETIGRPLMYDIQNLNQISLVFSFDDVPEAMPHFPALEGNLLYQAHYTAGVHVYDVSDPLRPVKVAFYDTWQGDDGLFSGVYEATPFYPSGIFTASDMETGLYVFRLDSAYGLVRGTVRAGNKALSGASVRVLPNGPSFVTGTSGYFGLAPASGGSVTIECSKFGYVTQTATLSVAAGSQQTRDFTLSGSPTGTLKGTVRRASDQIVVVGADITLTGTPAAATTSGMGKYTLMKVPEGSYTMRAESFNLGPAFASISLPARTTLVTDFALQVPAFFEDGETDQGWTLGEADDDATAGRWVREAPIVTTEFGHDPQPGEDHSPAPGTICFVTGNAPPGFPPLTASLLGGKTTLTSPSIDLSAVPDPRVSYWLWFYNTHWLSFPRSTVTTQLSNDGGASWTTASTFMLTRTPWVKIEIRVQDYIPAPSSAVRIRFIAENRLNDVVEVLIDDIKVYAGPSGGTRAAEEASRLEFAQPAASALEIRSRASIPGRGISDWAITLSRSATIRADLYDVRGRLIRRLADQTLPAGDHVLRWDGRLSSGANAASGVYWLRVRTDQEERGVKLVLAR